MQSTDAAIAEDEDGTGVRSRARSRFPLAVFGLIFFSLAFSLICVLSFLQKSPTIDEPIHLFGGYSYLKWGDYRVNPEHPPFAKMWAALPLLAFDLPDPRPSRPHWDLIPEDKYGFPTVDIANDMLFVDGDAETLFFFAKLQMVFLGILLGIFVYRWSRELFGLGAGVFALLLYGLDPNILAHSTVVHTDVPFAAFFFIATYFFWRGLNRPGALDVVLACVFFGLAAITKYSSVAILPVWGVLGVTTIYFNRRAAAAPAGGAASDIADDALRLLGMLIAAAVTAYLFIWAAYGFHYAAIPGGLHPLHLERVMPDENTALSGVASFIADHRLFPEAWIYGQLYVLKYLTRTTFLFGQSSDNGFWAYFPVAFLVKTPVPTILLMLAGAWMLVRGWIDRARGVFLLIPVAAYFVLAIWSRANIGLRYILPVYPFLFVLAGAAAAELWKRGRWMKRGVVVLGAWLAGSCLLTYPNYLAYFNELVGGPKNGYKVLLDSNVDWGQDLKGLKRWMDANGVKKIRFLYFGWIDPEYYGIDASFMRNSWIGYDPPATLTPEPFQYVAMSVHLLYGLSSDTPTSRFYRSRRPVAVIDHSIFIYKIDGSEIP